MLNVKRRGFTLVELLTVVAIIAMLIGILVPAVNRARQAALKTSVKAQLYGISQGLEMFKGDFGYYPSSLPQNPTNGVEIQADRNASLTNFKVQGAHRLVFALLGRDKMGCPAKTGTGGPSSITGNKGPDSIKGWYYSSSTAATYGQFSADSIDPSESNWGNATYKTGRKGPYIDPKGFSVIEDQVAKDVTATPSYVWILSDKYDKQTDAITSTNDYSKHSTILYYCANERGTRIAAPTAEIANNIYYPQDNEWIVAPDSSHDDFKGGYNAGGAYTYFWNFIEDQKAIVGTGTNATRRPYNPDSFLLISKGYDGQYGTEDDVTNWTSN